MNIKIGIGNKIIVSGGSMPSPLTPYDLALPIIQDGNTVAWYDSQDLTTITKDGLERVAQWNDKLLSGHDLLQAANAKKPIWSVNGILFDGILFSDYMQTATFILNQPVFIYIVVKQVIWANISYIFDGFADSTGVVAQSTASPGISAYAGFPTAISYDLAINTWGIVRVLFNGAGSKFIVDNHAADVTNTGPGVMAGFTLGSAASTGNNSNIQVKEILIRNVSDTAVNEIILYNYLKYKYSL